jgi:subtilisin family serine protease
MATRKQSGRATRTKSQGKQPSASHEGETTFTSTMVRQGLTPRVGTVVYVHGIGNKPEADILKCQWDRALFRTDMGDRTRMAYWVDRERYPSPEEATCADSEQPRPPEPEWPGYGAASVSPARSAAASDDADLTKAQRAQLQALEARMLRREEEPAVRAKVLPFKPVRDIVTRLLTRLFLHDVQDFLYRPAKRKRMEDALLERLRSGGGPFIVVAHSQGSLITYNALRRLDDNPIPGVDVSLLVTIGSPLGIKEIQDVLTKMSGRLKVPECVANWVNVADRLDPVALDPTLRKEFSANKQGVQAKDVWEAQLNPDWETNPHSSTGYLSTDVVREAVREAAGSGFAQVLVRSVIVRDLARELERGHAAKRHKTLIQLSIPEGAGSSDSLQERRRRLVARIEDMGRADEASDDDLDMEVLQRFVSARLTRENIERLRTEFRDLQIARIWKNQTKRALISQSCGVVQARPAHLGYQALGERISWAVLDTGISAGHRHFAPHQTVVEQWDCTKRGQAVHVARGSTAFDKLDKDGHGTHVAGIIAGEFTSADGTLYSGMAPRAKLYGFKVLNDHGEGDDAWIIKALDKIAEINETAGQLVIQGLNLSLGGSFDPSSYGCGHTPLCQELRRLWNQGVLVCIAAGNEGYAVLEGEEGQIASNMDLSIGDPANLDEAIAVGSVHKLNPHTYGVSFFSSRGPTADGRLKPDLVAPGEGILSAAHDASPTDTDPDRLYIEMSGTSQATPHVSGMLAAFLSVRREFIGYPNKVKETLLSTCTDLGRDRYVQGHGMPNLVKMLLGT